MCIPIAVHVQACSKSARTPAAQTSRTQSLLDQSRGADLLKLNPFHYMMRYVTCTQASNATQTCPVRPADRQESTCVHGLHSAEGGST